jgi:hypothetical protein
VTPAGEQLVFVSHISEDEAIADWLKGTLNRDFLGMFQVFVSSDTESVRAGERWLDSVQQALERSSVLITLCSPRSIKRPWINFEVGAAWINGKPIVPVCHSGLTPRELPLPLALAQGLLVTDPEGLEHLYRSLADKFGVNPPPSEFASLAEQARDVEGQLEIQPEPDRGRDIARRIRQSLEDSKHKWRTLERVAVEAGVSEDVAADVLRADDEVRFSRGTSQRTIVGLKSRVPPR